MCSRATPPKENTGRDQLGWVYGLRVRRTNDIGEGRCLAKSADELGHFDHSLHIYSKRDVIISTSLLPSLGTVGEVLGSLTEVVFIVMRVYRGWCERIRGFRVL